MGGFGMLGVAYTFWGGPLIGMGVWYDAKAERWPIQRLVTAIVVLVAISPALFGLDWLSRSGWWDGPNGRMIIEMFLTIAGLAMIVVGVKARKLEALLRGYVALHGVLIIGVLTCMQWWRPPAIR